MRLAPLILTPALLGASEPAPPPDLRTLLGTDPAARILFAPPGCWDGLVLGTSARAPRAPRRGMAGRTVEVWDFAFQEAPRREGFALYLEGLRDRLSQALAVPPPSHGALELAELVMSDPANPQKLDLTKVKSLQERFNRLPPNGSPVKP